MNKILVKIHVPAVEEQYDIWIPTNKKVSEVIQLLVKGVNEFSGGNYMPTNMPMLYDKVTAKAYDINRTVKDNRISNASEVILI